jgi:hypothetical protein
MQIHFNNRENGPERLVSEAEIHFEEGPLAGWTGCLARMASISARTSARLTSAGETLPSTG